MEVIVDGIICKMGIKDFIYLYKHHLEYKMPLNEFHFNHPENSWVKLISLKEYLNRACEQMEQNNGSGITK